MKNILLVCGAGMSTSLLMKRMEEADLDHQYHMRCADVVSAKVEMLENDMVLLAPHIGYLKDEFAGLCSKINIPCYIIDLPDYTRMNGRCVLCKISDILKDYYKTAPFHVELVHNRAGVMSNLIVLDMKKKAVGEERDWQVESCAIGEFTGDKGIHMVLLEYQIEYEYVGVQKKIQNPLTVVEVVPKELYTSFNGRRVFEYIHRIYPERFRQKKEELKAKFSQGVPAMDGS